MDILQEIDHTDFHHQSHHSRHPPACQYIQMEKGHQCGYWVTITCTTSIGSVHTLWYVEYPHTFLLALSLELPAGW